MEKQRYRKGLIDWGRPGNRCEPGKKRKRQQGCGRWKYRYTAMAVSLSLLFTMQPITAAAADPAQILPLATAPGRELAVTADPCDLLGNAKDKAMAWLRRQLSEEPEKDLPNDTLDILQLFRNEGEEQDISTVCGWEKIQLGKNTDQDARYAAALCDGETMEEVMERQNPDGGFGLADGYQSDPLDSMLVLQGLRQCSMWQEAEELLPYFASARHEDGGYSYTREESSDPWLTARIGHEIFLSGRSDKTGSSMAEQSRALQGIDAYILSGRWDRLSEKDFLESAWASVYSYERGLLENAVITGEELLKLQQEDGSFYRDIQDTVAAVSLMNAMCSYLESIALDSIRADCSTHILETGKSNVVQVTVTMNISVAKNQVLQLAVQAEDRGQVIDRQVVSLSADSGRQDYRETVSVTFDHPEYREGGKDYTIHTLLYAGEDCLGETIDIMAVRKKADRQIKLQADVTTGQACGIHLGWNDISDEETAYGYRVYRQRGNQEWETRSTWDGEEKVKVLNIYPCDAARDYLRNWMEKTLDQSGEPAGRGLFAIDAISIEEYNRDPERYLMEEGGTYRYDVLMFGTYDANAYRDLTELSYGATSRFIQSGRGVLFGHDTVVHCFPVWNTWFPKFAPELGAVLQSSCVERVSSRVKVVNGGFLTSYPWKLDGILNIPPTHSLGQCAGGSLGSTVWMAMDVGYNTDPETGAMDAPYLFSRNQMAMIQTGHSNGQATDDERKIIANTLFYLKQLTSAKETEDKSFYDEAAPVIASAQAEGNSIHITAEDKGTDYRYYVEGVPQGTKKETETRKSNIVEATALSGIQGYLMSVDNHPEEDGSLTERKEDGSLKAEILPLQQADGGVESEKGQKGTLTLPSGEREAGTWYIHLRAVDYAGNISQEVTVAFRQKENRQPWFHTGYGLFSIEKDLNLNCSEAKIAGDIYSGKDFNFGGSILSVGGACRTVGSPNIYGWKLDVPQKILTEPMALPDYRREIRQDMEQSGEVQDLTCYNSTEIREPVICSRTTGAWCPDLKINASLASQGDISLNTNTLSAGETEPVVVMSEKGDITVNCTSFQFNGLLYAPEGTVSLNVSQCKLAGTITAKEIKLSGTYFDVNQPDVP